MGTLSDPPTKKRKHRPSEVPDAIFGESKKKKEKRRKVATLPDPSPWDESRKHKPTSSRDKGKSRAVDPDLPSAFCTINAGLVLSIPPVFASNMRAGAEEMLDSMVMRYIPSLQGVLLAHSNIRFMDYTASIRGDCPFAVCNVSFDATVWAPRVSMKLVGRVNLCSPDHISLLVHRTFNVSIPRHHIPQEQWVFEYGPAENDPEFGRERDGVSKDLAGGEEDTEMTDVKTSGEAQETESSGRWVHHLTGSKMGDPDGYVEFTVIGLTVANEMLSLQGSIQSDPFSEHVPHSNKESASFDVDEDSTPGIAAHETGEQEQEEDEEESDEDGFRHLARLTDRAQASQKAKRAQEEAERHEKASKRKRRESGEGGESTRRTKKAERERMKEATA